MENTDITDDNSVDAFQPKQNELDWLEKNIWQLHRLADELCRLFPQNKSTVLNKSQRINVLWSRLKESIRLLKLKLEEKHALKESEDKKNDLNQDNEFKKRLVGNEVKTDQLTLKEAASSQKLKSYTTSPLL